MAKPLVRDELWEMYPPVADCCRPPNPDGSAIRDASALMTAKP